MRILVIGGSDAGISAALRARECDPASTVTMLVADAYPNFSICGIPYRLSGEVADWPDLAHRTTAEIVATGIDLRIDHTATAIDPARKTVTAVTPDSEVELEYDRLVIGTGAVPLLPPIAGLDALGPADGVHLLHTMDEARALDDDLRARDARRVVIIGAGYIGIEMAEALTNRGIGATVLERFDGVLPRTLDQQLADEISAELESHGVEVHCGTTVTEVRRDAGNLTVVAAEAKWAADAVLVVSGVAPNSALAATTGVRVDKRGAIVVDRQMRTNVPDVWAAGDCVHTHHALLDEPTYLPLGTTAHKQGRVAGENAAGGQKEFAGIVGTQVVRVFDRVVAATGLREVEAAGYSPLTVQTTADDHKRYYPGATPIQIRLTGDRDTGRLLGAQLVGTHGAEIAKRVDTYAVALQNGLSVEQLLDLDLSYTPPLGSPWDATQLAAQGWLAAR
ncbi:FAD-dependent oxidoreductase [Kribbella jiaozuonensis]|uniref:CoA-disulfide reductase n=1 Tax=Kribbella jiaozuonensis TaxID=2575441 RepID=A0A4U3M4E7_9ACTN|nr:FAD-dependent oxidoreductase [Kribbella jiaozuonensis]TKK82764.1 CoA-disulfide reductase [Kribbella jiaozuonensis]